MVKPVCSTASRILVLLMALGVAACGATFDARQPEHAPNSLGQALYANFCERIAAAANPLDRSGRSTHAVCHAGAAPAAGSAPKLVALHNERARFIDAVDTVMASDPALAEDLRAYLTALLPAYDDGTVAAQARASVDVLSAWRSEPPVEAQALARLGHIDAPTRVPAEEPALLHAMLAYPRLQEVLAVVAQTFAPRAPGHAAFLQLETVLAAELTGLSRAEGDRERSDDGVASGPLREFLLSSLPEGLAQPQSRWVLAYDPHGLPQVARLADGSLPAPFVEIDGAPAASAEGGFVDAAGRALQVPAWGAPNTPGFDAMGRAVDAAGRLRFVYHDAGTSVLAGVLAQAQQVVARNPALLAQTAPALRAALGQEHPRTRRLLSGESLQWRGFDANTAPLAEAAHALGWVAQQPGMLPGVTALADGLWQHHEAALAAGLRLAWQVADWAQAPELRDLRLRPDNTALDDFIDLGVEIAKVDGLLEDVHAALQDPATRPLGELVALHMTTRDLIDYSKEVIEDYGLQPNGPVEGDFVTLVDRASADPMKNRSVMERLLHLVHDSQQRVCSGKDEEAKRPECYFFQIDDAALFYLKSIIGTARFVLRMPQDDPMFESFLQPGAMAMISGIEGYSDPHEITDDCPPHPVTGAPSRCAAFTVTPQAAARMMFVPFDKRLGEHRLPLLEGMVREPLVGSTPITELHHSTLFAWELHGFFDAMRPLLQAFAKHEREDLVLRLLNTMHKHWARQDNGLPELGGAMATWHRAQTGLSQYEPLMARVLSEGRFAEVAASFLDAAQAVKVGQIDGSQALAAAVRQLLVAPTFAADARIKPVNRADGALVSTPSPLHVLTRALRDAGQGLPDDAPSAGVLAPVAQALLPVECAGKACALRNREAHALVGAGLRFAREHVRQQADASSDGGGMKAVGEGFTHAVLQAVESPLTASMVQVLGHVAKAPHAGDELGRLFDAVLTEQPAQVAALATLVLSAAPQPGGEQRPRDRRVPGLQHALASLLPSARRPEGMLDSQLALLAHATQADSHRVLSRTLKGLTASTEEGAALQVLADVFAQVNRAAPGVATPLRAADYVGFAATLEDFLQDRLHGFARLLDVIAQRKGGAIVAKGSAS